MITTVTMNPCIDRTITLESLKPGGTNKVIETRRDISGKGINVSVVLAQLGVETRAIGVNYSKNGDLLTECLDGFNIAYDLAYTPGELRTNIKIFDKNRNVMTECNESGNPILAEALEVFKRIAVKSAGDSGILVFGGSVPSGVPSTFYREIIDSVKGSGAKIVVDTYGDLLTNVFCPEVYLIKPNIAEFEEICGTRMTCKRDVVNEAKQVLNKGVRYVCVSLGGEGALLISDKDAWYCEAPDVEVRGIQGAGDSMVAGMCAAIDKNLPPGEMLRWGTAACGGSLMRDGTLLCKQDDFDKVLKQITNVTLVLDN